MKIRIRRVRTEAILLSPEFGPNSDEFARAGQPSNVAGIGNVEYIRKVFSNSIHLARELIPHFHYIRSLIRAKKIGLIDRLGDRSFKYFHRYLIEGLKHGSRRTVISFHYEALRDRLLAGRENSFADRLEIWSKVDASSDKRLSIEFGQARLGPMEGESELRLLLNAKRISTLTFSLAPGSVLGLPSDVMVIGGVQGAPNSRSDFRTAARLNDEIAPFSMLLIAAKAFGEAMAITQFVGVSNEKQIAYTFYQARKSLDYDAMWEAEGGRLQGDGLFVLSLYDDYPEIRSGHRSRTRRKRRRKAELRSLIHQNVMRMTADWRGS